MRGRERSEAALGSASDCYATEGMCREEGVRDRSPKRGAAAVQLESGSEIDMPTICTLNLNGICSAGRRGFARWLKKTRPDACACRSCARTRRTSRTTPHPRGLEHALAVGREEGLRRRRRLLSREQPRSYVAGIAFRPRRRGPLRSGPISPTSRPSASYVPSRLVRPERQAPRSSS